MKTPLPSEQVVDDSVLLADRLIRSLHRSPDGHLGSDQYSHKNSVEKYHNVAILYIYTADSDGLYSMHEHYVYSSEPHTYGAWCKLATEEAKRITKRRDKDLHGVYGWTTANVQITPLRTGDLFITVDKEGARGVRLAFNSTKAKRETRKGSKREKK